VSTTAVGRLRYQPQSRTGKRNGARWLVLSCDPDWFDLYAPQAVREAPPTWVLATDTERPVRDGRVPRGERLAILRPTLEPPEWGPHISVVRGEDIKRHRDLWGIAVRAGDVGERLEAAVAIANHHRRKAANLRAELPFIAARRVNDIAQMEAQVREALAVASDYDHEAAMARKALRDLRSRWHRTAAERGFPARFAPGAELGFKFEPSPRTNGHHWWFDVRCKALPDLREAFGLPRRAATRPHLSFAVREGCDGVR